MNSVRSNIKDLHHPVAKIRKFQFVAKTQFLLLRFDISLKNIRPGGQSKPDIDPKVTNLIRSLPLTS